MRILFYIDKLETGGKERRMLELIRVLGENKEYTLMIVLMNNYIGYDNLFKYNIDVRYLIRNSIKDLSIFHKFFKLVTEFKPDIIHSWSSMTSIYALPTIILKRVCFFNNAINDAPPKVQFWTKEGFRAKITYPFSTKIFANSLAGIFSYKPPKRKTICIYNGFDIARIKDLISQKEIISKYNIHTKYNVGMVGSFTNFKDYPTYIQAIHIILSKNYDVTFWAIGDGPDLEIIKNSVLPQFQSRVIFPGNLSRVESYINVFDIGVLSTFSEGISNSIMEYMALSKPAISVDEGGTRELIQDGLTGFLVPPRSPELLAQKIELLLNDESLRIQMGIKGKERILSSFSLSRMVELYIEQYRNTLKIQLN